MNCKAACIPSVGADQPAEVVEDAPQDLVHQIFLFPPNLIFLFVNRKPECPVSIHKHEDVNFISRTSLFLFNQ